MSQANLVISQAVFKLLRHPLDKLPMLLAALKGCFWVIYYRLARKNVVIRMPFFVHSHRKFSPFGARVDIQGSGSVVIGRFCSVFESNFHGLSIVTLSEAAKVIIGDRCALGGVSIRCSKNVYIGERTIAAYSLIQDCLFLHEEKLKSQISIPPIFLSKDIRVGSNVWLSSKTILLGGCRIYNDSVLAVGSLIFDFELDEFSIAAGSPVKKGQSLHKILNYKRATVS